MDEKVTCKQCILNSKMYNIKIDKDGYCSECNTSEKIGKIQVRQGSSYIKKMETLFNNVKEKNNNYDVIVLFSGGKDSTYLLYWLKKHYNLKVLALAIIHPFLNEVASKNMETIADKLEINLMKYYVTRNEYTKFIKFGLLNGEKYGLDEFAGCSCCGFFHNWIGFKLAVQMKVPILVDGLVKRQVVNRFLESNYIVNKIFSGLPLFNQVQRAYESINNETLKDWLISNGFSKENVFINIISPFTFMEYHEEKAFDAIEKLGLDKDLFLSAKTNCKVVPLFDYINFKKFDCPTYIRQYANYYRKDFYEIENNRDVVGDIDTIIKRKKSIMLSILKEYKELINSFVEKEVRPSQMEDKCLNNYNELMEKIEKVLDEDDFKKFQYFKGALHINEIAEFFNINLKTDV